VYHLYLSSNGTDGSEFLVFDLRWIRPKCFTAGTTKSLHRANRPWRRDVPGEGRLEFPLRVLYASGQDRHIGTDMEEPSAVYEDTMRLI